MWSAESRITGEVWPLIDVGRAILIVGPSAGDPELYGRRQGTEHQHAFIVLFSPQMS